MLCNSSRKMIKQFNLFKHIGHFNSGRHRMKVITAQFFFLFVISSYFTHSSASIYYEGDKDVQRSQFPDGFFFGTSSSSYQIEGAYLEDGKGYSNWDVFTHIPGTINNNENGDIANDHYHKLLEDIEIMHSLGVNSYRFSISWARILPRGRFGIVNLQGIMFYNKIIDNLLLKGIEPFVTIQHFDIPQELEKRYGSWLSPLIQEDYVYFAKICFQSFGDRVKHWITMNEPNLYIDMAYIRGWFPPARCSAPFGNCSAGNSDKEPLIAMHNMLLSHAKAVKLYREQFKPVQGGSIGIVVYTCMYEPARDKELDIDAAKRAIAFQTDWPLDPLVHGHYPSEMTQILGDDLPEFTPGETELVRGSIDFIGMNYYTSLYTKDCTQSTCDPTYDRPIRGFAYTTGEVDGTLIGEETGMPRFYVVPEGLEKMINYLKERYNNFPLFVTENGYSPPAQHNEQESLQDVIRVNFYKGHLAALQRAMRNGTDVRGYFMWTLMDNFEWTGGYSITFGLYYVDRQTLRRTPKLSARWFNDFLANKSEVNINNSTEGTVSGKYGPKSPSRARKQFYDE